MIIDDDYLRDGLHDYADVQVTDGQIDRAHTRFRTGVEATGTRRRLPNRGLVAAAAALVVVAGSMWWYAATGPDAQGPPSPAGPDAPADASCLAPGQVPTYSASMDVPGDFISGPVANPPGDAPCRLVLRKYSHPIHEGRLGKVWLFSDGRMITGAGGANGRMYLERRLTAAGVEQVRRMAIDLLTDVRPAPESLPNGSAVPPREILYQGRTWTYHYPELSDRLFDLSWLPAGAWLRQGAQPYEPAWWGACYGGTESPVDRERVLVRLPDDTAALLRGKDTKTLPLSWEHNDGQTGETVRYCTVVSAVERRVIADALHDAGFAGARDTVTRLGRIDHRLADIAFEALLPNGESTKYGA